MKKTNRDTTIDRFFLSKLPMLEDFFFEPQWKRDLLKKKKGLF